MRQVLFLIIIWVSMISVGCTSSIDNTEYVRPAPPGTPTVTSEQAKEIVKNIYKIKEIDNINRRHLEQVEIDERPFGVYGYTPIYWVIKGGNDEGTIYVSFDNPEHHFIIYN